MKNIIILIILTISVAGMNSTAVGAAPQGNADVLREASFSHLQLKGTLFTESLNPLAVIENTRNGQIIMYELGDDVEGLKIAKISRGEIVLSLKGKEYILSFPEGGILQPGLAADKDGKWYNITRDGDTITTDRATVRGAILRVRDIMKDLKAGPYSEEGKKTGIAITALNEEGILKEIGIKQGDIIKTVNGFTLNSPYQIFNAYRKLKDNAELKVEITRKGTLLTLTYRVEK
ncbi:MAG: PDZ domain-containing protein [Dehalococcoidia bacterium]|nr:MAG: PDZ domain-containing protein [Dehalococcoidia bacterium]